MDFGKNRLWINLGNGSFEDKAGSTHADNAWNDMGVAIGDPDGDGDFDFYVTNIEGGSTWSVLLQNTPSGQVPDYGEVSRAAGVIGGSWGWGATWLDFDNDGWLDLAHTNGFVSSPYSTDASRLYHNNGAERPLSFTNVSAATGFNDTYWGAGLVAFDRDRDGDLDLFHTTNSTGGPARLLDNTPNVATHHFLEIKPRMPGSTIGRSAPSCTSAPAAAPRCARSPRARRYTS